MSKNRVEAFTDGVMAIVITVLVLNLVPPSGPQFSDLMGIEHKLLVYFYSFILVAVYWNNHHHLFQIVNSVNWKILWANNFLLFSLTLFPFTTSWLSNFLFEIIPQMSFGIVLLMADISFLILLLIIKTRDSGLDSVLYVDKAGISIFINILALLLGLFINPILVLITNVFMLLSWIIPNRYVEEVFHHER